MKFTIKLADKIICVDSLYESTLTFLNNYLTDSNELDFCVEVSGDDISNERQKYIHEAQTENLPIINFSDNYLETLALYRKIVSKMSFYNTLLFHGSVVAVDDIGFLFTAKSGTGKSTHTKIWRNYFGERAVMINDDKPLISVGEDDVTVYGTPWDGKHHLSSNTSVPLKAICILERGEQNIIERISVDEAYPMFLQQTYKPTSSIELMNTLDILDRLMNKVNIYRLKCNMEKEAAIVAYNGMKGD